MWIIEWSCLSDYEFNTTAWASENEALKCACAQIVNHIQTLDMPDSEFLDDVKTINDLVAAAEYRNAINHWNDCSYNTYGTDNQCWTVRQLTEQRYYGSVPTLDEYISSYSEEEDEEIESTKMMVDDHTCTTCGNTKCSKRESSCWKCGNPI